MHISISVSLVHTKWMRNCTLHQTFAQFLENHQFSVILDG